MLLFIELVAILLKCELENNYMSIFTLLTLK